jgi:hypothetical protein
MGNLFAENMTQDQIEQREKLKVNAEFNRRLVADLENTFHVVVEHKRSSELKVETVVYAPQQAGRYGWGFAFTATNEHVYFSDANGVRLEQIAKILNIEVSTKYKQREDDLLILRKAANSLGMKVGWAKNTACGDYYRLEMDLSPTDPNLSAKIKAIIGTMMNQQVVSKF